MRQVYLQTIKMSHVLVTTVQHCICNAARGAISKTTLSLRASMEDGSLCCRKFTGRSTTNMLLQQPMEEI
jgi:hypothetical protein